MLPSNTGFCSHSFRINFITTLLKFAPIDQVSDIIGHKDVKSTIPYNRYTLDKVKGRELLDKAIFNVKDEKGIKQEGEEKIKQRIIKEVKQRIIEEIKQFIEIGDPVEPALSGSDNGTN